MYGDEVDIRVFLQRPLMASIATNGPTLRAVWYIFEDGAFWWLTNTGTFLNKAIAGGEPLVVVVDVCDITTGEVVYVRARGRAELLSVNRERALRKFARYLGPEQTKWDPRFVTSLDDPTSRMARMTPDSIEAGDLSFVVNYGVAVPALRGRPYDVERFHHDLLVGVLGGLGRPTKARTLVETDSVLARLSHGQCDR